MFRQVLRLLKLAKPYYKHLVITTIALIFASILNLATPELVRRLVALINTPGGLKADIIIKYVIIMTVAYLLRGIFRFFAMWVSHIAAWRYVGDLIATVYKKLQVLSMRYYSDKQTGQIMSRVMNDTRNMEALLAHSLPDFFSNILVIISVGIMLFTIDPVLAALTLIPVPFVLYVSALFSKKVLPLFKINQKVLGELNGKVQENVSGIREIQSFTKEDSEFIKMRDFCSYYGQVNINANFANAIYHPSIEFLISLGTVIVLGFGSLLVMKNNLSSANLVGFFMYLSLFYTPLTTMSRIVEDIQSACAGGVRVLEILDEKSEIEDKPGAAELGRSKGFVEFENVSFSYKQGDPVLNQISFRVNTGEMLAIVGATGEGKTTITSLLERFYEPDSGRILVDGINICDITQKSLRENISVVYQDIFLFSGTIYDNIAFGVDDPDEEQVMKASRTAHADDFIKRFPEGYNTIIGERGITLSGGQKQRIAIARAILKNAPILILDEATSAVDNETEQMIQDSIHELTGKCTVIVIAHRLTTVERADRILVLKNGSVAESGTHEDLLSMQGIYSGFYRVRNVTLKLD
jgi:ATP-binding cassette, subfamily B, bacterial